jgi:hypothetical protein
VTITSLDAPESMIAVDFDQNGTLDLAVLSGFSQDLAILSGNGHGDFAAPAFWNAGNEPVGLAAGTFNADSLPDLAVVSLQLSTVSILLNTSH